MNDPRLTFEPESHRYEWDGREVKSVTQIIGTVYPGLYGGIPKGVLDRKRDIGIAIHTAIELDLVGALDGHELHPETVPYIESFRKWRRQFEIEIDGLEERFYSPLGYAGTIDFRGRIGFAGMPKLGMLLDWKTTSEPKGTHLIQTAGYKIGHPSGGSYVRGCLYLNDDGGIAKLIRHENEGDIADWMATLRVFNITSRI